MKNDIEFATNFMKADFEKKLRVKSIELFVFFLLIPK